MRWNDVEENDLPGMARQARRERARGGFLRQPILRRTKDEITAAGVTLMARGGDNITD